MLIHRSMLLLLVVATCAHAQTPQPLDLRLPQPADAPALSGSNDATSPGVYIDNSTTSVHGSFTSGVGYSKTFGTSTINAADLDVTHQNDDGRTMNLHIDVLRSTGVPTVVPRE